MRLNKENLVKSMCFIFIVISFISCVFLPLPTGCQETTPTTDIDLHGSDPEILNSCDPTIKKPILQLTTRIRGHEGRTEKIVKNSNSKTDSIELNSTGFDIDLTCTYTDPIDLTFEGHLSNRDTKVTDMTRDVNNCFKIKIRVFANERATGNYSCFTIKEPTIRSSFYIFVTPSNPGVLLHRDEEKSLVVIPNLFDTEVIIPCSTSLNNVKVQLWKQNDPTTGHTEWIQLDRSGSQMGINYNNKIGFILKNHLNIPGVYICNTTTSGQNDVVHVTVEKPSNYQAYPTSSTVKLGEGDKFWAKCEAREEIQIKLEDINFSLTLNESIYEEKIGKYSCKIETGPLKKEQIHGKVSCHFKSNNLELHQWNINSKSNSPTNFASLANCIQNEGGQMKYFPCDNWIECRLRQCQLWDSKCETRDSEYCTGMEMAGKSKKCFTSGIFQCIPHNKNVPPSTVIYFTGLKSHQKITDWTTVSQDKILEISKKSEENSKLTVTCRGSSFVFSWRFTWTILIGNKKMSIVVPKENITHEWDESRAIIKSEIKLNFSNEIMEVHCHAPIWNTTEERVVKLTNLQINRKGRNNGTGTTIGIYLLTILMALIVLY